VKMSWMRGLAGWAVLLLVSLAGCGGSGDSDDPATLRFVNASTGYSLLDVYIDDTLQLSGLTAGSAGDYMTLSAGTHATTLTRNASTTALASQDRTLASGGSYTVVAYGWEGALKTYQLSDDESAPATGKAKFRVLNTAPDAGSLDVYVTLATDSLDDVSPVASAVAGASISAYSSITQGTYRIRVTAAGDKTDLRFDLAGVGLADQQIATLILTPGTGGVLVHGVLLDQKGAATRYTNDKARLRLMASVADNATVAASAGGTALATGARSPLIGSYTLVPAGLLPLDLQVNGTAVAAGSLTAAGGADLTLMVHGSAAAPTYTVLADDNRLPASGSTKLRLVNGVSGLSGGLTLVEDYAALATDIGYPSASSYSTVSSSSSSLLQVTSPSASTALFSASEVVLQSRGVYTVFMMGGAGAPVGVLRRER